MTRRNPEPLARPSPENRVSAIAHPMPRNLAIIGSMVLALGAVEALAWWWAHPTPAGLGQPVLVYRPKVGLDLRTGPLSANDANRPETAKGIDEQAPVSSSSHQQSTIINQQSSISSSTISASQPFSVSASTSITPLPEIVAQSQPSLRCSTGTAARIDREDGVIIHLAFFEWNRTDAGDILEAYKHLPEQCLGAIGMRLIEHRPSRVYQVGTETIVFDHTVLRDRAGVLVHAFKGTWVSGMNSLVGDGFRGGADQWRKVRWKAALHRFHPAYSRVAQGAVRGIPNPDLAWAAFENAMLKDLRFER